PYHANMDAAVEAVLGQMSGRSAPAAAVPYRMAQSDHRAGTVDVTPEGIACTKAVCNYILETYGRFPGSVDAMHLMWVFQAHHIDTDFYDRYFHAGAYGSTHGAHMHTWHP